MGEVFAALAVIVVIAAGAGVVALVSQRSASRRAVHRAAESRSARWQVGERGVAGGVEVFLHRVTVAGESVDRIEVGVIRSGRADFESALLEARASAGNRAELLNALI